MQKIVFMRQLFGVIIILLFLTSCSKPFKTLDTKMFNEKIANLTNIKTPQELIKLYYNSSENEITDKLSIQVINPGNKKYQIILIHEGIQDDSQSAEKIIMTGIQTGRTWNVMEIKENWKCQNGKGHTSWGITPFN